MRLHLELDSRFTLMISDCRESVGVFFDFVIPNSTLRVKMSVCMYTNDVRDSAIAQSVLQRRKERQNMYQVGGLTRESLFSNI